MRATALTRSLLTIGFVALVGSGCGPLNTWLDAVQPHNGGTTSPPSGSAGTSGTSTGAGGSSGGPATGNDAVCVEITEGGPGTCVEYATYKIRSNDVCAQKNLFISNLKPGPMCGNGGVESMTFVCCPPPAPSPVTCSEGTDANGRVCKTCVDASGKVVSTDCNASVPGMMCVKIPDGGSTSCKPYDLWKQYGTESCAQQKMQLTDLVVGTPCGSNYQDVTYVCCATVPSGSTGAGGSTGTGGSGGSQMCIAIDDGGPSSCKDAATWKQYGADRCGQQNLTLTDLKLGVACDGGYSMVSYVCCGAGAAPGPVGACDSWVNPDGAVCKQCRDASGNVISLDCTGGKTPPNEICDVKTNADGSQCKTCYYSDGSTVSSCASP